VTCKNSGDRDLQLLRPDLFQGARRLFRDRHYELRGVVRLVVLKWVELTQGPMALNNIPPPTLSIPGLFEFSFIGHVPNYYLVLMAAIIAYFVVARLVYSRVGRAMIALRENEPRDGIVPALARWWCSGGRAVARPAQTADAGARQAAQ
jgi:Branched-chain amino acid transport system / permease component